MTNADYVNFMMVLRRIERAVSNSALNKRELFAAMAMQGLVSRVGSTAAAGVALDTGQKYDAVIAAMSLSMADALIAALNQESK